jgi:enoyl-CoA hydratase/carnithine racemase
MPPTSDLTVEVADHVATVRLSLADGRFDRGVLEALGSAAGELRGRTADVYAVVIASEPDFGAGWSLGTLSEDVLPGLPPIGEAIEAVAAIPQPVVAAVSGQAHSAGLELALACDVRVAGSGASFAMPETALGVVPRAGGTQRLPRAVGRAHALRLLLTGEPIDAAEALRIGLVSEVVEDAAVRDAARAVAATIASRGPIATRLAKEAVYRGADLPLAQGLTAELDLTVILQTTADRAEGVQAFVEKRPPQFENR